MLQKLHEYTVCHAGMRVQQRNENDYIKRQFNAHIFHAHFPEELSLICLCMTRFSFALARVI